MIELLIALVMIALPGVTIVQCLVLADATHEQTDRRARAIEAAQAMADRLAATPIDEVVARFGPESEHGGRFRVPGLDREGPAGRIRMALDEIGTGDDLDATFGLPRDLDGDGRIASTDVRETATVLPVLVEVVWGARRVDPERFRLPVVVVR